MTDVDPETRRKIVIVFTHVVDLIKVIASACLIIVVPFVLLAVIFSIDSRPDYRSVITDLTVSVRDLIIPKSNFPERCRATFYNPTKCCTEDGSAEECCYSLRLCDYYRYFTVGAFKLKDKEIPKMEEPPKEKCVATAEDPMKCCKPGGTAQDCCNGHSCDNCPDLSDVPYEDQFLKP